MADQIRIVKPSRGIANGLGVAVDSEMKTPQIPLRDSEAE